MRTRTKLLAAVAVVVVALVGGVTWWYLRDDAPAPVALSSAVDAAGDAGDAAGDADGDEPAEAAADVSGTWVVDTETGDFDFEQASGTFVGFRIQEELASIGSTTAVGRTGDVTGTLEIDGTTVTEASFEVDATTITTNESRRDDQVQRALETSTHPTATFTLTEPIELGDDAGSGAPVTATAVGELTIHGVTRPVELGIEAQLVDDTIVVVGSTDIVFSDYGVTVPQARIVLSVDDQGVLELQLLLRRG